MLGGELGIKIKSIRTNGITHPYRLENDENKISIDLSITSDDGNYLHICGENDWGYLALEIIKPIYKEAENLINDVKSRVSKIGDKPEVIILGLNQQRIMDIYCGEKGKCTEIAGIPIARSNEIKEFRYIGNIHDKGIYEKENFNYPF